MRSRIGVRDDMETLGRPAPEVRDKIKKGGFVNVGIRGGSDSKGTVNATRLPSHLKNVNPLT